MLTATRATWLLLTLTALACDEPARPEAVAPSVSAKPASGQPSSQPASSATAPSSSSAPASTSSAPAVTAPEVEPPPADAVSKLAQGTNAFGVELYGRLRSQPGNLIISPASLSTALAMTWGGAKGETATEMQKVLRFRGTADEIMTTSGTLTRSLQSPSRSVTFRVANQLFADKSFDLLPSFVDKTKAAFGAPVERLDFKGGAEPARLHINGWVEQKTEKRIKDLIPPGGVNAGTPLVLANAIYFLGDWDRPFTKESTQQAAFFRTKSDKIDVATMKQLSKLLYGKSGAVHTLELPYKGGDMSMVLLVPDAVDGLDALEKSLDDKKLDGWLKAAKSQLVSLSLPKFEIAPAETLKVGEHLVAMGMKAAFDAEKADFSALSKARISIGQVFHKGFVRVDEKGTEAAAASAVVMAPAGAPPQPDVELKVDRPFLFLIRDTKSGLVLFWGRVVDPSKK